VKLNQSDISESLRHRFWIKVNRAGGPDSCWPWMAEILQNGYGRFTVSQSGKKNGRKPDRIRSHRFAYIDKNGDVEDGMLVCHSCDVNYSIGDISYRRCCNPSHLWKGTTQENTADRDAKGRSATGDRNGARLHPDLVLRGDVAWSHLHPERLPRGEDHPRSKLAECSVREIWCMLIENVSQKSIAERFMVSMSEISHIKNKRLWRHVTMNFPEIGE
jgi:hypothetical protein